MSVRLTVRASERAIVTLMSGRERHRWAWKRAWAANHAPSEFDMSCSNNRRRGGSTTASPSDEEVSINGRETPIVAIDSASPSDVSTTAASG